MLTDGTIPAALVAAADEAELPVTLIADRHQIAAAAARTAWRGLRRGRRGAGGGVLAVDDVVELDQRGLGRAVGVQLVLHLDEHQPPGAAEALDHDADQLVERAGDIEAERSDPGPAQRGHMAEAADGAAEIAGALVGPDTLARAAAAGADPGRALERNDAHGFFGRIAAQVVTGPTLTNVNDLRIVLVA